MIGDHPEIVKVKERIKEFATTEAPVLIIGETGTGKEVVAEAIHKLSNRPDKLFRAVNCGALNENTLDSELFGHVKGSFTSASSKRPGIFKSFHGGTVYLDEMQSISMAMQVKLLRLTEFGEIEPVGSDKSEKIDVRIISSFQEDPFTLVAQGLFREDLLNRLNIFTIKLPPLNSRKEDIPDLAEHFLELYADKYNKQVSIEQLEQHFEALIQHSWNSNVRALKNTIERAVATYKGGSLELELPEEGADYGIELSDEKLKGFNYPSYAAKRFEKLVKERKRKTKKKNASIIETDNFNRWLELNTDNPKLIVDECEWLKKNDLQGVFKGIIRGAGNRIHEIENKARKKLEDLNKPDERQPVQDKDSDSHDVSKLKSIYDSIAKELSENLSQFVDADTVSKEEKPPSIRTQIRNKLNQKGIYKKRKRLSEKLSTIEFSPEQAANSIKVINNILSAETVRLTVWYFYEEHHFSMTFIKQIERLLDHFDSEMDTVPPDLFRFYQIWLEDLEELFLFSKAMGEEKILRSYLNSGSAKKVIKFEPGDALSTRDWGWTHKKTKYILKSCRNLEHELWKYDNPDLVYAR
ncbi:sigma 54-interacting transcriptional regulator [bacterium]|nr:sigma 54-interacting transcriptional regulator [bacterium]